MICSLLIFVKKEIRDVEMQTTCARVRGESHAGSPEGRGLEEPSRQWRGVSPNNAAELASRFGGHPTMIHQWKRALLEGASGVFERGGRKKPEIDEGQVKELHAKIG